MSCVAGSALIQACEKAGATIPRYESFPVLKLLSTHFLTDTAIMSALVPLNRVLRWFSCTNVRDEGNS